MDFVARLHAVGPRMLKPSCQSDPDPSCIGGVPFVAVIGQPGKNRTGINRYT